MAFRNKLLLCTPYVQSTMEALSQGSPPKKGDDSLPRGAQRNIGPCIDEHRLAIMLGSLLVPISFLHFANRGSFL